MVVKCKQVGLVYGKGETGCLGGVGEIRGQIEVPSDCKWAGEVAVSGRPMPNDQVGRRDHANGTMLSSASEGMQGTKGEEKEGR